MRVLFRNGVSKIRGDKIKKISSSSFADSKNKPHVACGAYEIMVATLYECSFAV